MLAGRTVNVKAFFVNSCHLAARIRFCLPSIPRPTTKPSAKSKDSSPICRHISDAERLALEAFIFGRPLLDSLVQTESLYRGSSTSV